MQGERHPNGTSRTISTRSRIRSAAACSKGVVTSNLEPGANIGTQVSSPSGMFAPNYKTPRALQMTGVGFGYAPMLSSLKATSPAPANSRSPNTTIARRLRQNAMRGLNITCPAAIVTVDEHGFIELAKRRGCRTHGSAGQAFDRAADRGIPPRIASCIALGRGTTVQDIDAMPGASRQRRIVF